MNAPYTWQGARVPIVHGIADKRIGTGAEFDTAPLGTLWTRAPSNRRKHQADAFLPSLYREHDARNHDAQKTRGQFVSVVGDVDSGLHGIKTIEAMVWALVGTSAHLIFSTAKSWPADTRWRIILPLIAPVDFTIWRDGQQAFFDFARGRGIDLDGVTERPGQIAFLQNVPAVHEDTGEALRDARGPLYFTSRATSVDCAGLSLDHGPIAKAIADVRRRRAECERMLALANEQATRRRANRPVGDGNSLIDDFNKANPLAVLLKKYNYKPSRDAKDYRSPLQTSGSFATCIVGDGSKWFSLSGSDATAGLGMACADGRIGDAFDLFVHFEHAGDRTSAFAELCRDRDRKRFASKQTPPPLQAGDPGPLPDAFRTDLRRARG